MLQERIEIIKIRYKNGENLAETVRKTRTFLGRRRAPCRTAIKKLVKKFELLGQVSDVMNKTRARRSKTADHQQRRVIDLLREKFPDRVIS